MIDSQTAVIDSNLVVLSVLKLPDSSRADRLFDQLLLRRVRLAAPRQLCRSAFEWATRLGQKAAYDCFYLAAAERLGAEFWTADERLSNRASQLGAVWVHWMGEIG
jgi:predicted nucleic acid-binding protein